MITCHKLILITILLSSVLFSQVRFDANFESGNLESVTTTDSITYTVKAREDIGGRWFYFKIKGVKNRFVRVKISNSDVTRAMYSYDDVNYYRFSVSESPAVNQFEKTYTSDSVYVSYYTPYTLSYLKKRIAKWISNSYCRADSIGATTHNLPVYELTITDRSVPDSLKENIWIHARTHPGETPSSWHFDGILNTLLNGDEVINFYLKNFVFHCIPFTNPDGVYYGRSRTNHDGVDVESNWNKADSLTSREVLVLKQRMAAINRIKPVRVFLNLHSQAAQYCTFWIHTASSTSNAFYKREMQFTNINISDNAYFKYSDFSYSNLSMTFPEGWQWKNWGDRIMALTYETPYDFYSTNIMVDSANLAYLGQRTVYSIAEYLELSHPRRIILDNSLAVSNWTKDTAGTDYFSANFQFTTQGSGLGPLQLTTGIIPKGSYTLYAWWPANAAYSTNAKISARAGGSIMEKIVDQRFYGGRWNQLGSISLNASGEIVIAVSDTGSGRIVADAFRLIYTGPPVSVEVQPLTARSFELFQNYPNPFNGQTIIKYQLNRPGSVKLYVFNALGQLVAKLADEFKPAGTFETCFNAENLASGSYYIRLSVDNKVSTKSMILIK